MVMAFLFSQTFVSSTFAEIQTVTATVTATNTVVAPPLPVQPPGVVVPPPTNAPPALVWDATSKDYAAKPGEVLVPFVFNLTNVSSSEVIISNVTTSCGCTVAQLPSQPWHLAPGTNGEIKVTVNLTGKNGHISKGVNVISSVGNQALSVNVDIPAAPAPTTENERKDRAQAMEIAKADRQAVFKGDCASCHVTKGMGKTGADLYAADCGVCHDSPHRAAFVPDLRAPKGPRDRDFWVTWITYGRQGSMMPAFASTEGGPLNKEQIDALATYLDSSFPKAPTGSAAPGGVQLLGK